MNPESKETKRKNVAALLPVDLAILEMLPDEGQMLGYTPIALQVRVISDRPGFEELSGNQIAGRLKSMEFQGLVVTQVTLPLNMGLGWQRTRKGREVLERNGRMVEA